MILKKNALGALAGIAWAGALLSSAAPASALAVTITGGPYALCQTYYSAATAYHCGMTFGYNQPFKFLSTTCNSSSCYTNFDSTYVESLYSVGRKTTSLSQTCPDGWKVYGLSTCAC
jgi:hypothetical protein